MNSASESDVDSMVDLRRYEALLGMADLMVHYGTLADLFRELAVRLHSVATFEVATFSLHEPSRDFAIEDAEVGDFAGRIRRLKRLLGCGGTADD